jgi:hypothetical protein
VSLLLRAPTSDEDRFVRVDGSLRRLRTSRLLSVRLLRRSLCAAVDRGNRRR